MSDTGRDVLLGGPNILNTNCCIPRRGPRCIISTDTVPAKRSVRVLNFQLLLVLDLVLDFDISRLQAFDGRPTIDADRKKAALWDQGDASFAIYLTKCKRILHDWYYCLASADSRAAIAIDRCALSANMSVVALQRRTSASTPHY